MLGGITVVKMKLSFLLGELLQVSIASSVSPVFFELTLNFPEISASGKREGGNDAHRQD